MLIKFCRTKIYGAKITFKELHYEGSITIDPEIMKLSGIKEGEMVAVFNVNNGLRLETYVIAGHAGSGAIGLNGAAARLGEVGDELIILAFAYLTPEEAKDCTMHRLRLGGDNRPI